MKKLSVIVTAFKDLYMSQKEIPRCEKSLQLLSQWADHQALGLWFHEGIEVFSVIRSTIQLIKQMKVKGQQ
jgi:hypothetical protein